MLMTSIVSTDFKWDKWNLIMFAVLIRRYIKISEFDLVSWQQKRLCFSKNVKTYFHEAEAPYT